MLITLPFLPRSRELTRPPKGPLSTPCTPGRAAQGSASTNVSGKHLRTRPRSAELMRTQQPRLHGTAGPSSKPARCIHPGSDGRLRCGVAAVAMRAGLHFSMAGQSWDGLRKAWDRAGAWSHSRSGRAGSQCHSLCHRPP